jgi:hypothetical protein
VSVADVSSELPVGSLDSRDAWVTRLIPVRCEHIKSISMSSIPYLN